MKRYILIIFVFVFLFKVNCVAQAEQFVDSLLLVLKKDNSNELKVNNDIASYYLKQNDSILIDYVNRGLSSSDNLSSEQAIRSYRILGDYYLQNYRNKKAIKNYFTALSLSRDNAKKAELTIQIAISLYYSEDIMSSLDNIRQAKGFLFRTDDDTLWYKLYYYEGLCYFHIDDFDLAKLRWEKAKRFADKLEMNYSSAQVAAMLGEVNLVQNSFIESVEYFNESISKLKEDSITNSYALVLGNLGHLYKLNQNYSEAEQYFDVSAIIYEFLGNKRELGNLWLEKGLVSIHNNSIWQAYEQFEKADSLFEIVGSNKGRARSNNGLAMCYRMNGDYNQAFSYLKKARSYAKNSFSDILKAQIRMEYGELYLQKNKYDSAFYYAHTALKYFEKANTKYQLVNCYRLVSDISYANKDYKSSIEAFQKSAKLREEIIQLISSQEYKQLLSKSEIKQKETVIDALTQEKQYRDKKLEQNKATIKRQNVVIILVIVVLGFVGLSALVLARWAGQKRKDNKKLQLSNTQIAQQKEEIETQKQFLQEVNEDLERLSIIARETDNAVKVMNPVGRVEWVNEGYTRLYGYTLEELEGIEHMNLLGSDSNVDIASLVSVWYGDKKPISFESLNKQKNGQEIWVQTTLTPVLDVNGKISRMIAIDSDITRLKKAESMVKEKNRDITASITYAKRIQDAIMMPVDRLRDYFPNSFLFYKPKSIVSGDFYWFGRKHDRMVVVCADSTGHGVPGAFMSLLGISFLNKIVNEKGFVSPAIILNRMRMNIINHLHHTKRDVVAGDGMDMSVISIDRRTNTMEYAGAMNPIYIVRDNDLIELKPDRMTVGFFDNEDRPFSSTSISLKLNDQIYMFTDGFYDQFGGMSGAKLKAGRFRDLLKSCTGKTSDVQKDMVEEFFNKWKGGHKQVDDILVMGITIT